MVSETPNPDGQLLQAKHGKGDLFICDVADAVLKDLVPQMEHPFYSLSKKPDRRRIGPPHARATAGTETRCGIAANKGPNRRISCGDNSCARGEKGVDSTHMVRRIRTYIHELKGWPGFRWDHERVSALLVDVRHRQGRLTGRMEGLGFQLRAEAVLHSLTEEVLKSSEIEGEKLDRDQVRSSIARRLGIDIGGLLPADRDVEGVVEMMLDATQRYDQPLTGRRLFDWHAALFPTGRSGMVKINVGAWRNDKSGPMQVVSGAIGKERVHYEAPAADRVRQEMKRFLDWFEKDNSTDLVVKSGVAHLWFVTIHPFDDGNGRIARAIADMVLARSERSPQRFYSMSAQIRQERKAYYDILEATQKGDLDITHWLEWFLGCLGRAFERAETILAAVLSKARFWERFAGVEFNERQRGIVNKLLNGFEGKLTSSKWAKLGKCSQDTALRDIEDLVRKGVLKKDAAGGRSTSYSLS